MLAAHKCAYKTDSGTADEGVSIGCGGVAAELEEEIGLLSAERGAEGACDVGEAEERGGTCGWRAVWGLKGGAEDRDELDDVLGADILSEVGEEMEGLLQKIIGIIELSGGGE